MQICPSCGEENSDRARFCQACAAPLGAHAGRSGEVRKTVSVVFSDVTGSTALGERLDPESLRRLMGRYFDAMRSVLGSHGGAVEKFIGDAVMAVFGIPQLHEDDALRAVRAAAEMRERLAELNAELRRDFGVEIASRTGVNTGAVVAGDPSAGQTLVTGDAVNTAARLEQAARAGEVLIGETTYRLVRDAVVAEPAGPIAAKGKAGLVQAYRLVQVIPGAEPHARRLDAPMVGRDRELRMLLDAFERVTADPSCRLVTVLGEAGVGKSRLVLEFLRAIGDGATVLRGRCLPYGEGITYWPIAEAVRQAAGISEGRAPDDARRRIAALLPGDERPERIAERVAQLVGLGEGARTAEEGFWAIRRLFEGLARTQPLVLVFDDIHWAEESFLDLLAYIVEWTREVPVLVLCLARKDLLDRRPGWAAARENADLVVVEPLGDTECEAQLRGLLGTQEVPRPVTAAIARSAEGNPLFVEELLSMLIDEGLLRRDDGRWVPAAGLAGISVPPTVHALLAARLEQLDEAERRVLQGAAVVGEVFDWTAVTELVPDDLRPGLGGRLMALVRKEVIRPAPSDFAGEDAFRFRHILIRDAAYDAIPKETRADLHERFAGWLESTAADRLPEVEEIVGYHQERAYRYREELGALQGGGRELALGAADHLGAAGRRAFARGDMPAAANLLGRAVTLLAPDDPIRPPLSLTLVDALRELGEFNRADVLSAEALEAAIASGQPAFEARLRIRRLYSRVNLDPSMSFAEAIDQAERIAATATQLDDPAAMADALMFLARLLSDSGRSVEGERTAARARESAERASEVPAQLAFVPSVHSGSVGPHPITEMMERARRGLARSDEGSPKEAFSLLELALLEATLGRFHDARAHVRRAANILGELGMAVELAAIAGLVGGIVEMLAGDPVAAEQAVRPGYEALARMGETGRMSSRAAFLARALYEQGRYDEAIEFVEEAARASAVDDMEPQIWLRGVRAKVLARRRRIDEAEREARDNVTLAERTDWTDYQGTAWLDLCEVLLIAGRSREAGGAAREAAERFEAKGNLVMAARARAVVEELAPPANS